MKIGIMQPYFLPYIGYFQLMNAVDEFVVYDNIQFTKKGWINRNRLLLNGKDAYVTLPLKKDSDYLDVRERQLADGWSKLRTKMLNKVRASYLKAPHFTEVYSILESVFFYENKNLFEFVLNSIQLIKTYLEIPTLIKISSELPINHQLKSTQKVLAICNRLEASEYINPIGGIGLYEKENFKEAGIDLFFLKTEEIVYPQFKNEFIPFLSIVDVMMFNPKENIKEWLNDSYSLI